MKRSTKPSEQGSESLTIEMAVELATTLVTIGDQFPLRFLTETDFYPLVHAFIAGRLPGITAEHAVEDGGRVDFRTTGTNPALVELAVAPRILKDAKRNPELLLNSDNTPQLYAGQNLRELKKLLCEPRRFANRYVILIDFSGKYTFEDLKQDYLEKAAAIKDKKSAVQVVFAKHGFCDKFLLPK